jgi:hypothetical protein
MTTPLDGKVVLTAVRRWVARLTARTDKATPHGGPDRGRRGEGEVTTLRDGTCARCGAPLVRQTDRRKAAGYSLRCSRGGHPRPGGGPQGGRVKRSGAGRPQTRRPRRGTQEWMTNPAVVACKADGCFWDAATCPTHGRKK